MSANHLYLETPLIYSNYWSLRCQRDVYLKLECLQPSGSFKLRGISYMMQTALHTNSNVTIEYFCSSGGNAGLAAAYTASLLQQKITICIPASTPLFIKNKLQTYNAEVIVHGAMWSEADARLKEIIASRQTEYEKDPQTAPKPIYVPPYDHADIWTGNATLVNEIYTQLPQIQKSIPSYSFRSQIALDTTPQLGAIICSVGGGGLFNGIAQGLIEHNQHHIPLISAETIGSSCLAQAIHAGERITLPAISSIATSLGAAIVSEQSFNYVQNQFKNNYIPLLVSDAECVVEMDRLVNEHGLLVEPACGAAFAALNLAFSQYRCANHDDVENAYINANDAQFASEEWAWGRNLTKITEMFENHTKPIVVIVCGGSIVTPHLLNYYKEITHTTEYCRRFDMGYSFLEQKLVAAIPSPQKNEVIAKEH